MSCGLVWFGLVIIYKAFLNSNGVRRHELPLAQVGCFSGEKALKSAPSLPSPPGRFS